MSEQITDIETLIFDFDGTLADTMELGLRISNSLARRYGFRQISSREELEKMRNKPTQEALKDVGISKLKLPLIANNFRKQLNREICSLKPHEGVREMIEILAREYKLGIVSSNSSKNIRSFLAAHQLEPHFRFFSTGIRLFRKHVTLNQLIRKNAINRGGILLIGDETRDVEAAKKAGIAVVAVSWGFHSSEVLSATNPDFLIDKPQDLVSLLNCG